jgi:predicted dehydrogenase
MKRRSFLSRAITGAAGVALGSSLIGVSSCSVFGSGKIVLGLIGCGSRGIEVLIKTCQGNKNVQVKYVCDVNDKNSAGAAEQINKLLGYAPEKVKEMDLVFNDKDVDAVIIATPGHWHALATIKACAAGKDVYVEANLSHTLWEGRKIQEAAARYKRVLQAGFQNRSAAHAISAREYIKSGKLGQIIHVKVINLSQGSKWAALEDAPIPDGLDWKAWIGPAAYREYNPGVYEAKQQGGWNNYWAFGGGALAGEASHLLDLARMVLGDPGHPSSVYCSGGNWCWGSERETPENQCITYDYGKYAMTCETGNSMSYMKGSDWMHMPSKVEIYGTEGLMYLGLAERGWQAIGTEGKILFTEAGGKPDDAHFKNFIDCIRSRKSTVSNAEQGNLSSALAHLGNIAYRVGNKKLDFDGAKEIFKDNNAANGLLKTAYSGNYVVPERV